jgi:fermentation-respiration switch protein FrsA (DUF1100 family)
MKKNQKFIIGAGIVASALAASDLMLSHYLLQYTISRTSKSKNRVVKKAKKNKSSQNEEFSIKDAAASTTRELERALGNTWHDTIAHEEVSITSYDGLNLYGELFRQQSSDAEKYVILVHGYKSTMNAMYHFAYHYWQKGFNILLVDLRACGNSEGDYIGMGWLDRRDMLGWINFILSSSRDAKIVLHGESMGAATVMMVSGEESLPDNVKAIIEDCGYTCVYEILHSEMWLRFGLPSFPLLNTASKISQKKSDYAFKEASALKQVARSHTPTLFIHGTGDEFVPFSMLNPLYEACSAPKECFTVENAGHCCSAYYDSEGYYNHVFDFIEKYI